MNDRTTSTSPGSLLCFCGRKGGTRALNGENSPVSRCWSKKFVPGSFTVVGVKVSKIAIRRKTGGRNSLKQERQGGTQGYKRDQEHTAYKYYTSKYGSSSSSFLDVLHVSCSQVKYPGREQLRKTCAVKQIKHSRLFFTTIIQYVPFHTIHGFF